MTDEQYLRKLIEEGEHDQQDFKYKIQEAAKLARSVSAFANTRGGRLLIGVRDDGHISGVKSEEEIFMMHAAAFKYCTPESAIRFDTLHVEGRSVVIATIPPAQRKPIKAIDEEGTPHAYVRIKDENIAASPVHLEMWQQEQRASNQMEYGETAQQMMRALAEHPGETLNRRCASRRSTDAPASLCWPASCAMDWRRCASKTISSTSTLSNRIP